MLFFPTCWNIYWAGNIAPQKIDGVWEWKASIEQAVHVFYLINPYGEDIEFNLPFLIEKKCIFAKFIYKLIPHMIFEKSIFFFGISFYIFGTYGYGYGLRPKAEVF